MGYVTGQPQYEKRSELTLSLFAQSGHEKQPTQTLALDAQIVSCSFDDQVILRDIDLKIPQGQCVVITGFSGCGKSTLLKIINGLIPDHEGGVVDGSLVIAGKDHASYLPGELACVISCVFQNPKEQFFSTDAEDEVAFVGESIGIEQAELKRRVQHAFDQCGIAHLKKKSIFEMSGGELQKVALASTLVSDGSIVLLDEPSASLDVGSCLELGRLIAQLKAQGKTLVIAEHRLFYLKGIFDRLVIMRDGRIVADCAKTQVTDELCRHYELRPLSLDGLISRAASLRTDKKTKVSICSHSSSQQASPQYESSEQASAQLTFSEVMVARKRTKLTNPFSLELNRGEVWGVVGGNGCGKTTLLKTLAGLLTLQGSSSLGSARSRLKQTTMLLQDVDTQFFFPTVEEEVIGKGDINDPELKTQIIEGLKAAELWDKRLLHPHELSGGEKQRLALLFALLSDKRLYLLDEVSSGLDLRRMHYAADQIARMSQKAPVMLVTHDAELLFQTAHWVLCLEKEPYVIPVSGHEQEILAKMGYRPYSVAIRSAPS